MALNYAGILYELREVDLKHKPQSLINISPKATVPVLKIQTNSSITIIDESLEIMLWALKQNDPDLWLSSETAAIAAQMTLIKACDFEFKPHLDRYKYASHQLNETEQNLRDKACLFVTQIEQQLTENNYLFGNRLCLADHAIYPFIRQFSKIDVNWFLSSPYNKVKQWVDNITNSALFNKSMQKSPIWSEQQ